MVRAKKVTPARLKSRTRTQTIVRVVLYGLASIAVVLILLILWFQIRPIHTEKLRLSSSPYTEYAAADRAAEALVQRDRENSSLNPDCGYRYLAQPAKVERVLVIRHGLTNCPRQFDTLAEKFHQMGYAVLITRIPEHGMADRMAPNFSQLTAEETLQDLNSSIDIALGLGDEVDVMGLSAGANEVAYVASERDDLHQAIIVDPIFTPVGVPTALNRLATGALITIPNQFVWWSDKQKNLDGPTSAYYGWQSHPVGQYLRITEALYEPGRYPQSTHVVMITNENDAAVNNEAADRLAQRWRNEKVDVTAYRFPVTEQLNHDLIDPLQVGANIELSYPKIIELSTKNYSAHGHH